MSSFLQAVQEFAKGYLEATSHITAVVQTFVPESPERGRIERLCGQLGWAIDPRDGDRIVLRFKDPLGGVHSVLIDCGDEPVVALTVYANASMPAKEIPQDILSHLLWQNVDIATGAWQVTTGEDGNAYFRVAYCALGAGLTKDLFKIVCESLIGEARAFDKKMRAAGLLQLTARGCAARSEGSVATAACRTDSANQ
jgi:hypothetical protein